MAITDEIDTADPEPNIAPEATRRADGQANQKLENHTYQGELTSVSAEK